MYYYINKGYVLTEVGHGTATRHYRMHKNVKKIFWFKLIYYEKYIKN